MKTKLTICLLFLSSFGMAQIHPERMPGNNMIITGGSDTTYVVAPFDTNKSTPDTISRMWHLISPIQPCSAIKAQSNKKASTIHRTIKIISSAQVSKWHRLTGITFPSNSGYITLKDWHKEYQSLRDSVEYENSFKRLVPVNIFAADTVTNELYYYDNKTNKLIKVK